MSRCLRIRQVADMLGMHPETVRRYVHAGHIPARRTPTGTILIEEGDVTGSLETWKCLGQNYHPASSNAQTESTGTSGTAVNPFRLSRRIEGRRKNV